MNRHQSFAENRFGLTQVALGEVFALLVVNPVEALVVKNAVDEIQAIHGVARAIRQPDYAGRAEATGSSVSGTTSPSPGAVLSPGIQVQFSRSGRCQLLRRVHR
jgi:hypothetical protein